MSQEAIGRVLLTEVLTSISQNYSQTDVKEMVEYQLENLISDSFVVTRGC